jgi:hypothetical protein
MVNKKNILLSILLSILLVMLFSGCSNKIKNLKSTVNNTLVDYYLSDHGDGTYFLYGSKQLNLNNSLYIAAKKTLDLNMTHFVLLNAGVNNLNGFPINNVSDMNRYINLHKTTNYKFKTSGRNMGLGKKPLRTNSSNKEVMEMWFKPVNSDIINSFISTWDASKVISDIETNH